MDQKKYSMNEDTRMGVDSARGQSWLYRRKQRGRMLTFGKSEWEVYEDSVLCLPTFLWVLNCVEMEKLMEEKRAIRFQSLLGSKSVCDFGLFLPSPTPPSSFPAPTSPARWRPYSLASLTPSPFSQFLDLHLLSSSCV